MSINIAELKNKVIDGASVDDLSQDELAECVDFCAKTWAAWKKSNQKAAAKAALVKKAVSDPDVKAYLASKGINL